MSTQYLANIFSLGGKTAIVNGGTGGLGSASVSALVQAGVSLVVSIELPDDPLSGELGKKLDELGSKVLVFTCDLANPTDLRECYQRIRDAGVTPDILLNCAGIMRGNPCTDATDEEWSLPFDVNAKPVYLSMEEFGRKLISLGRPGKIINIASIASFYAGVNTGIYSFTKGAVLQMTKAFSNEWAVKGIQVNRIAPGFMKTH